VVAATQLATPTAPAEPEISLQASTQFAQVAQSTQITQSTPTSTSTPLVIQGGVLPSGETYDEFRARLMSGLTQSSTQFSTVPSTANVQSNALVASSGSTSYSASDTVVISSSGIRSAVQYSTVQLADARSDGGYLQIATRNGQLMMSANSTRVATVHFSNGSSNLDANDRKVLRQVIALQKLNGGMIQIIGHASSRTRSMDPVRHKMVNYQVSVSRADAIANAMVRLGAQKENIMIGAVSDSRPLYFEVMPSGEAGNRRAEIYIDS
jgi:outer membrane protein OmpA-like peptidoglycan-associated protein